MKHNLLFHFYFIELPDANENNKVISLNHFIYNIYTLYFFRPFFIPLTPKNISEEQIIAIMKL